MKNKIILIVLAIAFSKTGLTQPILIQMYSDVSINGNNNWNLETRWDFSYDQDGDTLTKNQFYYLDSYWNWEQETLNTYVGTYLTRSFTQTDFDGYSFKTEYVYDSEGKKSNEFFYTKEMIDPTWTAHTSTHYLYINEQLDQILIKAWSDQYQTYRDLYKTVYSYPDTSGMVAISYTKTTQPAPNDWVYDKQKITTIDNELILHEQFYDFDQDSSVFLPESEIYYDYDSTGILDSVEYSRVGANGMEKIKVENYFYNPDGSRDYTIIRKKVAGNWRYDHRLRYVYFAQLGLDAEENEEWTVYPNPITETVKLDFSEEGMSTLKVYDSNGNQLMDFENLHPNEEISFSGLAIGVYTFQLITQKSIHTQKVVKQ